MALDAHSGKIVVDSSDATTANNIFAIGDAINVSSGIVVVVLIACAAGLFWLSMGNITL